MDTMSNKTLKFYLVITQLLLIWITILSFNLKEDEKKQKVEIQVLNEKVDSLQNELFNSQVELGRFEVAYDIFSERNPKAATQFDDIISKETE